MGRTLGWTAVVVAALLAGCGSSTSGVTVTQTVTAPPPGSSSGSSTAATSSASTQESGADFALVTVPSLDSPSPVAVTFYSPDGTFTAPLTIAPRVTQQVDVAAGAVWYVDSTDHLVRVAPDRSTQTMGLLAPAPADARIAVSPDGSSWLWPVWTVSGSTVATALWEGGRSTAAHRVLSRTSDAQSGPYLVPVAWPQAGPLVAEQPGGIGGRILYDDVIGQVDRLDLSSGAVTKVLDSGCQLSDVSVDGTIVCSDVAGGKRDFRLVHPDGTTTGVTAPGLGEFGNARFDPTGKLLAIGYEVTNGATGSSGATHVSLDVVDLSSGQHTTAARAGLTPLGWTASGNVIADDRFTSQTAFPGYLVNPSGPVVPLGNSGEIVAAGGLGAS